MSPGLDQSGIRFVHCSAPISSTGARSRAPTLPELSVRRWHGGCLSAGEDSRIPGFQEEAAAEAAHNAVPLGRAGTPLDIARLAVFLCSDDAQFIIGQTLVADGGTTALMSLFPNFREQSKNRFGTGYVPGV